MNFLGTNADANSQQLIRNLIAYLAAPVVVPPFNNAVPTLGEWGMIGLTLLLILYGVYQIRRRKDQLPDGV